VSAWSSAGQLAILFRLHNCAIAAASVTVGAYLAGSPFSPASLAGAAAAFLVAAGGYALNDLYDVEADRVDKPWRPLASGRLPGRGALSAVLVTWAGGLALSALAGAVAAIFALSWMLLVWLYSSRLKSAGLTGHVLVSAVASSGFVLGAALGGNAAAGFLPFTLGLVFHFAREIVKGAADVRGDIAAGIRTLPAGMGERQRAFACVASIAAVMALSVVPFAAGVYGIYYLLPVLAMQPVLALCIYLIVKAGAHGRVATILKAVMPVGMLAFVLGGLQRGL
jgi:geranylgeranylglycerol-phosphate geranylgeranyltransferase